MNVLCFIKGKGLGLGFGFVVVTSFYDWDRDSPLLKYRSTDANLGIFMFYFFVGPEVRHNRVGVVILDVVRD